MRARARRSRRASSWRRSAPGCALVLEQELIPDGDRRTHDAAVAIDPAERGELLLRLLVAFDALRLDRERARLGAVDVRRDRRAFRRAPDLAIARATRFDAECGDRTREDRQDNAEAHRRDPAA